MKHFFDQQIEDYDNDSIWEIKSFFKHVMKAISYMIAIT